VQFQNQTQSYDSGLFKIESKPIKNNILNKKPTEILPEEIFREIDKIIMWILSTGSITIGTNFKDKVNKALEAKFTDTIKNWEKIDLF